LRREKVKKEKVTVLLLREVPADSAAAHCASAAATTTVSGRPAVPRRTTTTLSTDAPSAQSTLPSLLQRLSLSLRHADLARRRSLQPTDPTIVRLRSEPEPKPAATPFSPFSGARRHCSPPPQRPATQLLFAGHRRAPPCCCQSTEAPPLWSPYARPAKPPLLPPRRRLLKPHLPVARCRRALICESPVTHAQRRPTSALTPKLCRRICTVTLFIAAEPFLKSAVLWTR